MVQNLRLFMQTLQGKQKASVLYALTEDLRLTEQYLKQQGRITLIFYVMKEGIMKGHLGCTKI